MKKKSPLFLPVLLLVSQVILAQPPRKSINFDQGWELYRIDHLDRIKVDGHIGKGTSWQSQFNDEHIGDRNESKDSVINQEIEEAVGGFKEEYPTIRSLKWESVSLPSAGRVEMALNPGKNQFVGICYYRKKFRIPDPLLYKQRYIRFEGAMQVASVWINGHFVVQHQGGYLPFVVPLNKYIRRDALNEIIVRVDNRDNMNTPPGKPLARLGFLYWSGIYRGARLIATGPVRITDEVAANTIAGGGVFVRFEKVSACSATAVIKTQIENKGSQTEKGLIIKQILINSKGHIVLQNTSGGYSLPAGGRKEIMQQFVMKAPRLWSPDNPYLYTLRTEVERGGKVLDKQSQKIGIRSLSYSRWEGFKLNGKPLRIVGTNRHQDCPYLGNALSHAMQYRDLKRIKEAGMNFVRLSHYPQDPSVYDICDSLGLMVADPIPGWQFYSDNRIFKERVFRDIRETIRRDRNHPCVIMWEMSLNESYPPDSFRIRSSYIAHEEYPGNQCFTSGDIYGSRKTAWDVPYNGWTDPFGRPQEVQPESPGFVREYGDYEFGGSRSTSRSDRGDGENALLQSAWNIQWEHNLLRSNTYYPWTIGDAQWAFYDGFEAYDSTTSNWGIMDVFRLPKFSYYFYRSQMDPYAHIHGADNEPMVYIANWWLPHGPVRKVIIYSNCEEVALYINGTLVKKQRPDSGKDTPYGDFEKGGHPFDGGNCNHLKHPPFTFEHIGFEEGELKAVGYIHGKVVAEAARKSPGSPVSIELQAATENKPLIADGADAVFVYAKLVDKNGAVAVTDNKTVIDFKIAGKGHIAGPSRVKVRGGIAAILLQADRDAGNIMVEASAVRIKSDRLTLKSLVGNDQ